MECTNEEYYIESLGVDQGYANCGIAVVRYYPNKETDKQIEIIYNHTIYTKASDKMNKRIQSIYNFIIDVMNSHDIKVVGCEKLFVNAPMKTGEKVDFFKMRNKSASIVNTSFITGIIFLISAMYNVDVFEFAPTSVKKRVTNDGKADKVKLANVINNIALAQGITLNTDHESDAVGIAISAVKESVSPSKTAKNKIDGELKLKKQKLFFIRQAIENTKEAIKNE